MRGGEIYLFVIIKTDKAQKYKIEQSIKIKCKLNIIYYYKKNN